MQFFSVEITFYAGMNDLVEVTIVDILVRRPRHLVTEIDFIEHLFFFFPRKRLQFHFSFK